jgi:hypothetical protein
VEGTGLGQRDVGRGLTVRPKCQLGSLDNNLLIRTRPTALLISINPISSEHVLTDKVFRIHIYDQEPSKDR